MPASFIISTTPRRRKRARQRLLARLLMVFAGSLIGVVLACMAIYTGLVDQGSAWLVPDAAMLQVPASAAVEIPLPKSAFLEAARHPDGSFDVDLLEHRLQAAGLDEAAAIDVALHYPDLSLAIAVSPTPAFRHELQVNASQAVAYLDNTYPRARAALASPQRLRPVRARRWAAFREVLFKQGYAPEQTRLSPWGNAATSRALLHRSIEQAGLRMLRVAPVDDNPASMLQLAFTITKANEALQDVTGWSGGVLGLGGRVELMLALPVEEDYRGLTWSTADTGRLTVLARRDALAHEWLHALDYTLAQRALANPLANDLSSQMALFRVPANPRIYAVWESAQSRLQAAAPHWVHARRLHAAHTLSPYWVRDVETIAWAFQGYVAPRYDALGSDVSLGYYEALMPYAFPADRERQAQEVIWHDVFAQLAPLHLSRSPRS